MQIKMRRWPALVPVLAGTLALTAGVAQADVPGVSTGGATGVTSDAAKLHGVVNPKGLATTYYFEYGTTRRYGSRTPDASAGQGSKKVQVPAPRGGLAANPAPPYRLRARHPPGGARGAGRAVSPQKTPPPA